MLEVPTSDAAISAIAALQKRIRELEKERDDLLANKEFYEKHAFDNIMLISEREIRCDQAQTVGNDIMNYVSNLQNDVIEAKKKNRRLKELLFNMEAAFPDLSGNVNYSLRSKEEIKENSYLTKSNLNDYQILLREMIKIEPIMFNDFIRFKIERLDIKKVKIPQFVAPVLDELNALPKNFKKLTTKKQFKNVLILFKARDLVRFISNRLTYLSEDATIREKYEIHDREISELYKGYVEIYKLSKKFKV